jgi:hypothetical protein
MIALSTFGKAFTSAAAQSRDTQQQTALQQTQMLQIPGAGASRQPLTREQLAGMGFTDDEASEYQRLADELEQAGNDLDRQHAVMTKIISLLQTSSQRMQKKYMSSEGEQ